ncbi:MAG: hypothetical protein HUK20_14165 [Fibrobacter sp.]|nr:hypothetical protein [Fibrobacter sp.]
MKKHLCLSAFAACISILFSGCDIIEFNFKDGLVINKPVSFTLGNAAVTVADFCATQQDLDDLKKEMAEPGWNKHEEGILNIRGKGNDDPFEEMMDDFDDILGKAQDVVVEMKLVSTLPMNATGKILVYDKNGREIDLLTNQSITLSAYTGGTPQQTGFQFSLKSGADLKNVYSIGYVADVTAGDPNLLTMDSGIEFKGISITVNSFKL